VVIQKLSGFTPGPDGTLHAVIGDLAAGELRDLMFPITVAARGESSTAEIALATLHFTDVIGKTGQQQREDFVSLKTSNDAAALKAAVKIGLETARVRARAAGATLEAISLARRGQVEAARKQLADAIAAVKVAAKKLGDKELDQLVVELDELAKDLAKITPVPAQIIGGGAPATTTAVAPAMAPMAVEKKLRRAEADASEAVRGAPRDR
jgi:hypothetical protein